MGSIWTENEARRREQVLGRTGLALGIALLIGLVFIVLRLAYLRAGESNNPFGRISQTAQRSLAAEDSSSSSGSGMDYSASPGSPSALPTGPSPTGSGNAAATALAPLPAAPVYSPPPTASAAAGASLRLSIDQEEREMLRAALNPLREALAVVRTTDGRIGQRLSQLTAAEQEQPQSRPRGSQGTAASGATRLAAAQAPPEEREDDGPAAARPPATPGAETLRRQVLLDLEGLSGLVTLVGHPQRYPRPLRKGVEEVASSLRAYVMLSETAVGSTDRRDLLRSEAARHLSRSQQVLSRLESGAFDPPEPQ